MEKIVLHEDAFLIPNFLTQEECKQYIDLSEAAGYEEATITLDAQNRKFAMAKSIRNNYRLIIHDFELAEKLWRRALPCLPAEICQYKVAGFNEQFRFYRYDVGERFNKHRDGAFVRNNTEKSLYTFLIYLNEEFEGGATTFDNFEVKPQTGAALCFLHELRHTGTEVINGRKYVLRTDVMYRREIPA